MALSAQNPNLYRRPLPGLLVRCVAPVLKPLLGLCRTPSGESTWTVFASYMVGDFFMALPALKYLKKSADEAGVRFDVICRPDCVDLLAREGIEGVPFADPFRVSAGLGSFLRSWRGATALRGRLGPEVLDLDSDPRTAFWLKIAGVATAVSYRRVYSSLFDETFELPEPSVHQADRDMRVAEAWVKRVTNEKRQDGTHVASITLLASPPIPNSLPLDMRPLADESLPALASPWILSVWTRKPAKNWPLDRWEALLMQLTAENVPVRILDAPDGDEAFRRFRARWMGRTGLVKGSLTEVAEAVRESAGVIATDNFFGHMAGYYGKPVLWINRCSPAHQVQPRGPRTIAVTNPEVEEVRAAFAALRSEL